MNQWRLEREQWSAILVLAAIAWLLELLDGATAILMMQHLGPCLELNPVVREVFRSVGPVGVVLFKVGIASVVIPIFVYFGYRRRPVLARVSLLATIVMAGVGVVSNLL